MKKSSAGYVALEFVLAMGLLVLPTALVLLQVPSLIEQHNRLDGVAAIVANECANNANTTAQANDIARRETQNELSSSTSLRNTKLIEATCVFEGGRINQGGLVTSRLKVSIPSLVVLGSNFGKTWTINAHHQAIVPKYRGIND